MVANHLGPYFHVDPSQRGIYRFTINKGEVALDSVDVVIITIGAMVPETITAGELCADLSIPAMATPPQMFIF